jgi:hypothetical protein
MVFSGEQVAGLYKLECRVVNFVNRVSVGGSLFILDRYCFIDVFHSPFQLSSNNV